MGLEKIPFRSYTLEEEKKDPLDVGKIFTVRLNAKEYAKLREDMKDWNIGQEGKTLKFLAEVGRNVLHSTFGRDKIRWLRSPTRRTGEPD